MRSISNETVSAVVSAAAAKSDVAVAGIGSEARKASVL